MYTRSHGQVRVIAKGIKRSTRKRFAAGIDLLEIGRLVASRREGSESNLATLTEWKQVSGLIGLRDSLGRLYAAQYAGEITLALTEQWDSHPRIYDALRGLFESLCDASNVVGPLLHYMRVLLGDVGLIPIFEECVSCGRSVDAESELYFSSREGGLVCRDCEASYIEKRMVTQAMLPALRNMDQTGTYDRDVVRLLNHHVSHLIGRPPAVWSALRSIISD
jgi:DNA repair protein RecO (recombination protein O)